MLRYLLSRPAHFGGLLLLLVCLTVFAGQAFPAASAASQAHAGQTASASHEGNPAKDAAAGNGTSSTGKAEALLVAEVLLLVVVGRVLGEGMQRLGQPALMGNLLAVLVLGPSLFGWLWPEAQAFIFPSDPAQKAMIDGLSQIGILMLLLLTGMETDVQLVSKMKGAAIAVSLCGIALPFACGFALGEFLPDSLLPHMAGG